MKLQKTYNSLALAVRLWFHTAIVFSIGLTVFMLSSITMFPVLIVLAFPCTLICSLPVLLTHCIILRYLADKSYPIQRLLLLNFFIAAVYSFIVSAPVQLFGTFRQNELFVTLISRSLSVFACSALAVCFNLKPLKNFFGYPEEEVPAPITEDSSTQTNIYMETSDHSTPHKEGNNVLVKAGITAALVLLMLIPTVFIQNLVEERDQRHQEVVKEVSSKWAGAQTISGPYIIVPYEDSISRKISQVILLPEELKVNGQVSPEERPRSIYKVLLYRSSLHLEGNFSIRLPKEISINDLKLQEARICVGIRDFKGIEEKLTINFNNENYELTAGLPSNGLDSTGLSAPVALTAVQIGQPLKFSSTLKIKGSEQLRFMPLSANSTFDISSTWPSPSFDGYGLPATDTISDKGFKATWKFNQANLPFSTVILNNLGNAKDLSFGLKMVQPADEYAKTMRSVKYAILIIGLSFALFFITELMQNKPVHPLQYILVGFALVIFYTLLLSIGEFILFDQAYLIASIATVLLVSLYVQSHFKSWKTAAVFTGLLSALYAFIFVLISLEDTALLIGSIGLFIILALIMFASRKINWYNPSFKNITRNTA